MKIALFLEAYLSQASASATHVSLLAEGLVKLGHEVLIVTTDPETDDCYEQDGILCCPAKPSASLFGQSARVSKLPGLMPMIEAFSPDLIHIQTFTEIGGIGLKYAQKHQLPVVCTIHELQDVLEGYGANRPAVLFNKRQGQTLMKKFYPARMSLQPLPKMRESRPSIVSLPNPYNPLLRGYGAVLPPPLGRPFQGKYAHAAPSDGRESGVRLFRAPQRGKPGG